MEMRSTKQKEIIFDVVSNSCDPPTAETIYGRVKQQLPSVSLGTVYRNLNQLSESGKIKKIVVPDRPDRFDKTVKNHSHFYCKRCGECFDLDFDEVQQIVDLTAQKHQVSIEQADVIFVGLCKDCKDR